MNKSIFLIATTLFLVNCSQYSEPQGLGNSANQKLDLVQQVEEPLEATFSSIKLNIINKKCLSCHKPDSASAAKDIPLTKESEVLKGSSDLGDLIVPGDPSKSLFYRVMVKDEKIRGRAKVMPPTESTRHAAVTDEELQIVAAWISGVAALTQSKPIEPKEKDCRIVPDPNSPVVDPIVVAPVVIPEPAVLDFAFIQTQILEKKCMSCHKVGGKADELVFGSKQGLISLTNSFGQLIIVAGKPEQSLLYLSLEKDEAIRQDTRLMPPKKDVDAGKVKDITEQEKNWVKKWILEGAK